MPTEWTKSAKLQIFDSRWLLLLLLLSLIIFSGRRRCRQTGQSLQTRRSFPPSS